MKIKIGNRLKRLRISKKLTQKGLAAKVSGGIDYTYIGKIERGEQLPSLRTLMKISEALSVPVGSFFPEEPASAVCDSSGISYNGTDEKRIVLYEAVESLPEDDIPLLVEIVKALCRHRKVPKERDDRKQEEGASTASRKETTPE